MAIFQKKRTLIQELIKYPKLDKDQRKSVIQHKDIYGNTALHLAAVTNDVDITQLLLQNFPYLNIPNLVINY